MASYFRMVGGGFAGGFCSTRCFSTRGSNPRLNGDWPGVGVPMYGHPNYASWCGFSMSSRLGLGELPVGDPFGA